MTAPNECRTCEWLFVRWQAGSRRADTLCSCPTLGVNPRRCHEVALTDTCDGWAERPDPFEPREGEEATPENNALLAAAYEYCQSYWSDNCDAEQDMAHHSALIVAGSKAIEAKVAKDA